MEFDTIHLGTLILTAAVILTADHHAFQYMRGTQERLSKTFVTWSHRLVWVGLVGMIITGIILAAPMWEYLRNEPTFYVKMGFVLTLMVNAFFIERLSHVAVVRPWNTLLSHERTTFYVSGALSVVGWVGAATIGFFFL